MNSLDAAYMTMFVSYTAVFVFCVLGWTAGIVLFFEHIKKKRGSWRFVWGFGWLTLLLGLLLRFNSGGAWTSSKAYLVDEIGLCLTFLSPLLWLIAFGFFHKSNKAQKASKRVDYGEENEGVWPPPPNVPK